MLDIFKRRKAYLLEQLETRGQSAAIDLDAATVSDQTLAARLSLYRDGGPLDCGSHEARRRVNVQAAAAREFIDAEPRAGAPEDVRRRTRNASRLEREILSELDFAIESLDRAIGIARSLNRKNFLHN